MSRRKQENPQPRKRLINAETELLQDTLTCGGCRKVFVLSDIVKFIHHKIHNCNKENYVLFEDGGVDFDSDPEDPLLPPLVANTKPTSISAPICNRKGLLRHHNRHHLLPNTLDKRNKEEKVSHVPGVPTPIVTDASPPVSGLESNSQAVGISDIGSNPGISPYPHRRAAKGELPLACEDKRRRPKEEPIVKVETKDLPSRCSPKRMVDADTNTTITEPSTYTCSTCKQVFTSAWVLVQHAQHMHGIKIYVVTTGSAGGRSTSSTPSSLVPVTSAPPSLVPCSVNLALPPVVTPTSAINGQDHHPHHHVLPQQPLSLDTHPALQLLRMPLGERQFAPSLNTSSLFARPPSQDYRVDIQCTAGGNVDGQFHRLNHHPHHPHNASLPPLGISPFEAHNPFDRGHMGIDTRPRPSSISLSFEPQMDFYSQRLRQLAGATSPTMVPSPRKLTPPFSHPPISSSSQPSTPNSTPQPGLPLHASGNILPVSSQAQNQHHHHHHQNQNQVQPSSASSTSSKGGDAPGSPKLLKSWSCEFCGKSFRFQSNLIVHRRSHTGEKPYKCPVCRHACSQASKLKRHMKTHQNNNSASNVKSPLGPIISDNNSLESARSTPDSTSALKDGHNQQRSHSLADDDASDGQTADNEEEEEDIDDDEEEEEEEIEDDDDPYDANEVMIAEDLSTRGPASSTPVPRSSSTEPQKAKCNANENSSLITNSNNSDHNNGNPAVGNESNVAIGGGRPEQRQSLLSEVMDKIGLSNIQHYNEAYQKALEESSAKSSSSVKNERPHSEAESNASIGGHINQSISENGPERVTREEGNNNHHGSGKSMVQHSLEFGHGFFGAFDHHPPHPHQNPFDAASKRLKLDIGDHVRDRESLYAGLWLPSVHSAAVHRDLFLSGVNDTSELSRHNKSSSSESALKSVTPTNMSCRSLSPRPGTSGGGNGSASTTSVANLLVNASSGPPKNKEQRRNDTCEYCGKVFKNCSNLTVHRRSHTGEKPYKCELCSYACAQSSKLTRHMKTHGRLGKDVYRCRFCDMPFSVPSTLEKHMRKCVVNQNATGVVFVDRDSDSKELA